MRKIDEFIQLAESKCGSDCSWSIGKCGIPNNSGWSAAFITACGKETGIVGNILPETTCAQSIVDYGTDTSKVSSIGRWLNGAGSGGNVNPVKGDIILFGTCGSRAESAGIVKSFDGETDTIVVIKGDSVKSGNRRSEVTMKTYSKSSKEIKGYFRPDWEHYGV